MERMDLSGAVDLGALKKGTADIAAGFIVNPTAVHVGGGRMLPVLGIRFVMATGEQRKELFIPPQMLMVLIANLAGFGSAIDGSQVADVDETGDSADGGTE